jgi:uncharacterized glyoxalase superfamily protein PhnB
MEVGDSLVTLGLPFIHGGSPGRDVSTVLYVYVDNVDDHCQLARAAGAHQVADLEGPQWTFAQHLPDVSLDICSSS